MYKRTKLLVLAASGIVILAGATVAATAGPGDDPVFFVDGAVPPPDELDSGWEDESECVQYSADRPDVVICSPTVPKDWVPPPVPYHDEAICSAAIAWAEENRDARDLDADGCRVSESSNGSIWDVSIPTDGHNVHVPFDPTGEHPLAAHL
jgi:hypothetical protein